MVTRRAGHSLVELIVSMAVLGVGLTGVVGSSLLGARTTADALRKQEAVRLVTAVLDSLDAAGVDDSAAVERGALRVRWQVGTRHIVVSAETVEGVELFEIRGRRSPRLPVLPDDGAVGAAW